MAFWPDEIEDKKNGLDWRKPIMSEENNYKYLIEHPERSLDYVDKLRNALTDCRNELCLKCEWYKQSHLGSCDGCRWKQ